MNRRSILWGLALLPGTVVALFLPGPTLSAAEQPNIVFILTDDQRWDTLGCMGNPRVHTPHLDRLAEDGVLFANMFCTTSICPVSRASFILGQYGRRHGIEGFRTPLTDEQFAQTIHGRLRERGYRTGFVGKWGLGGDLPAEKFDDWKGFPGQGRYYPKGKVGQPGEHITARMGDQALEFLDGCTADRPFVLQVSTKAAHCQDGADWQFQYDVKYENLFRDITIPRPETATEEHFRALPEFLQTSEGRRRWKVRFATPEMHQKSVKDYYRLVAGIDEQVGRIVAKLRDKGLLQNTVLIFSSDHGFFLGEHGLAGKWFMHEESIRMPLLVYDPRLPESRRGQRLDEMVLNIDVAPTVLDMAGIEAPEEMQGRSLVPLLEGKDPDWRDEFFYEHTFDHPRIPKSEGVRTGRWKYVRYTSVEPPYEALFDLKTDPHEERNLADDPEHADKLADMRQRWRAWRRRVE